MKKTSKIMGIILALSLVFSLAVVSASASSLGDKIKNITKTKVSDITAVTDISGASAEETTAAIVTETPATETVEEVNEEANNEANDEAAAAAEAAQAANVKKANRIANTGDAGIAVAASVAAVAGAAYVIAKKRA